MDKKFDDIWSSREWICWQWLQVWNFVIYIWILIKFGIYAFHIMIDILVLVVEQSFVSLMQIPRVRHCFVCAMGPTGRIA